MKKITKVAWPFILSSCATTLTGSLIDEAGQPVKAAYGKVNIVNLANPDSTSSQVIDIDSGGGFKTSAALEPGEYLVEPLVPGYDQKSLRTKIDSSQDITIKMTAVKDAEKNPNIDPNIEVKLGRGSGTTNLTPPTY